MNSMKRQQGLSLIGLAGLLFLIVFFGTLTVKMSGSYFDHMSINKMIENSLQGQTASRFSETELRDRLEKNMQINQVQMDLKDALKVNKRSNPIKITLEYENRVHLFYNVDVVMMFKEEYEL